MKGLISVVIAISTGLIVLAGYFINLPVLVMLREILLKWAVILAVVAFFVGVFNLISVHSAKIITKQKDRFYSLVLIISLLTVIVLGLVFGSESQIMTSLFITIQLPVEKSLMALLSVTLALASIRLLRRRTDILSFIFIGTAVVLLLGTVPLPFGEIPLISDTIRPFIAQVLAAAGARGILIGVALGSLTTGLRILIGADRPYGSR